MAFFLGVDTGGTYTDAVVWDEAAGKVRGAAKSLTTHDALDQGIGAAAAEALAASGVAASEIALASLSTTLATNALVEGHGDPTALILIGFAEKDLARAGLGEALGSDPVAFVEGGHVSSGGEAARLDTAAVEAAVAAAEGVAGVAVAGVFAVRNPAHELAVKEIARASGLPVTCSHELSARLGGPKRALTSLLNGRLIGMISRLIDGAETRLGGLGIDAPLMVVKGDGSLMSAEVARARPIETILSGPAASVVGAGALTGLGDAVISDIGGTTTDIAVLEGGRPRIDPDGAMVGGWRTMVEAVAMRTHGLGGDSEVRLSGEGLRPKMTLGPRRAIPVSMYAARRPEARAALARQEEATRPGDADGVFAARGPRRETADQRTAAIVEAAGEGAALDELNLSRRDQAALSRLFASGALRKAAFTPTDAAHALGIHDAFDREAALAAARLFARQRGGDGRATAEGAEAISQRVIDLLRRRSAELILDAAFERDGFEEQGLSITPLARAALDGRRGLAETTLRLTAPVIGLGASAATYYPDLKDLLKTEIVIPAHAEVANAVGAVAGRVEARVERVVLSADGDSFQITGGAAPKVMVDEGEALAAAEEEAIAMALDAAKEAGAADPSATVSRTLRRATVEARDILIEARIEARAVGRPTF